MNRAAKTPSLPLPLLDRLIDEPLPQDREFRVSPDRQQNERQLTGPPASRTGPARSCPASTRSHPPRPGSLAQYEALGRARSLRLPVNSAALFSITAWRRFAAQGRFRPVIAKACGRRSSPRSSGSSPGLWMFVSCWKRTRVRRSGCGSGSMGARRHRIARLAPGFPGFLHGSIRVAEDLP